jgi:hypothetical protein
MCHFDLATYFFTVANPLLTLFGKQVDMPLDDSFKLEFMKRYLLVAKVMLANASLMVIVLNMFLFVDLRLIIFNPFYKKSKRVKIYTITALVFSVVFGIF